MQVMVMAVVRITSRCSSKCSRGFKHLERHKIATAVRCDPTRIHGVPNGALRRGRCAPGKLRFHAS